MKYLLTSAGVKKTSIRNTLVVLVSKPIAEANALCVPTAIYAIPGGAFHTWRFFSGQTATPHVRVGVEISGCVGTHCVAQYC